MTRFCTCAIHRGQHSMLAVMAKRVGSWAGNCLGIHEPNGIDLGEVFSFWVSLDAFVVLSGAVLTAYVGITGLISRMAKDRVLPQIMLKKVCGRGVTSGVLKDVASSSGCTNGFFSGVQPSQAWTEYSNAN